jgi:hypothetical protein
MAELLEKWSTVLDGKNSEGQVVAKPVTESEARKDTAIILENQEKWMMENGMNENTTVSGDIGVFTPILLPTVRRVIPNLLANEIVGVQPMSTPTGMAFAWRSHYAGSDANPVTKGINVADKSMTSSATTNTSIIAVLSDIGAIAIGDQVTQETSGAQGTVEYVVGTTLIINVTSGTFTTGVALDVGGTFTAAEGSDVGGVYPNELAYQALVPGYTGPISTAAGEVLGDDMPSITTSLEKQSVEAVTRKLKAEYTVEMVQDLRSQHGMNFEEEMSMILQTEIQTEVDRSLVNTIKSIAPNSGPYTVNSATGASEGDKFRALFTRILKDTNSIYASTRRGTGNWIIVSPNVATALQSLNSFMYHPVQGDLGNVGPFLKLGTLDGRLNVYLDNFATTDYVLVGYKGATKTDSGVIHCPYIPAQMTKVTDQTTFQPAMGIMTRSATAYNLFGADAYYTQFAVDFAGTSLGS